MDKLTQSDLDRLHELLDNVHSFFNSEKIPEVMNNLIKTTKDIESAADNNNLKQQGIELYKNTDKKMRQIKDLLKDINEIVREYVNKNI